MTVAGPVPSKAVSFTESELVGLLQLTLQRVKDSAKQFVKWESQGTTPELRRASGHALLQEIDAIGAMSERIVTLDSVDAIFIAGAIRVNILLSAHLENLARAIDDRETSMKPNTALVDEVRALLVLAKAK